jgi:hypothetical protein
MATNKLAEYKEIQDKIVRHLFDKALPVSQGDILKLIDKPTSETQYHIEQLLASKRIKHDDIPHEHGLVTPAFSLTEAGRKWVMEQAQ